MKPLRLLSILFLCLVLWTCQEADPDPTSAFSVVYDNSEFDQHQAVSIRQTSDGGYIILGTLSNSGLSNRLYYDAAYLVRVDAQGKVIWTSRENTKFRDYINPVPQLVVNGSDYLFWSLKLGRSLEEQSLELVKVSDANREPTSIFSVYSGTTPWYILKTKKNELVLVGVEIVLDEEGDLTPHTKVVKLDANYNLVWEKTFKQGENRTDPRLDELTPEYFFCVEGSYQNKDVYIFNTISEDGEGVSVKMLEAQNGSIVREKNLNGIFPIAFTQWAENSFAGAFTNLRDVDLNVNYNWVDKNDNYPLNNIFHELVLGNRIVITDERINNAEVRIFGATTKNYEIIILAWKKNGERFDVSGRLYLGSSNVYKISDFTRTKDGGLAIIGTTVVSGRFLRICLFKLSASQVNALAP